LSAHPTARAFLLAGAACGAQYGSVIFTHTAEQKAVAQKVTAELQAKLDQGAKLPYDGKKITTRITDSTIFYPAHQEHQRYLEKNPAGYCNHRIRFQWHDIN
jgi:peptide-methionine (S)-S-oxide reductase